MKIIGVLLIASSMFAQDASKSTGTVSSIDLFIDKSPKPMIMISGAQILEINDKDGNLMVRIDNEGKVTYGGKYTADESAKNFWEAMARNYSIVCKPIVTEKK